MCSNKRAKDQSSFHQTKPTFAYRCEEHLNGDTDDRHHYLLKRSGKYNHTHKKLKQIQKVLFQQVVKTSFCIADIGNKCDSAKTNSESVIEMTCKKTCSELQISVVIKMALNMFNTA